MQLVRPFTGVAAVIAWALAFATFAQSSPPLGTVYVSVSNASVTEGNAGTNNAVFTVSLSRPSTEQVSVMYHTSDASADSADYLADAGIVYFPAGTTSQTLSILVNGDASSEPSETFYVTLTNPINATLAPSDPSDLMSWTQLSPSAPSPAARGAHAVAYDEEHDRLMLVGGYPGTSDVWVLTDATTGIGSSWVQLSPAGSTPTGRWNHSVVYDPGSNRLILHGGSFWNNSVQASDTWVLTNANGLGGMPEWLDLPSAPVGRRNHVAAYDPIANRMIVFGGFLTGETEANDTWVLSHASGLGGDPTWTLLPIEGASPSPRGSAAFGYDPNSNRLLVSGGVNCCSITLPDDVWVLNHASGLGGTPAWTSFAPTSPNTSGAQGGAFAYDPSSRRLIRFGGNLGADQGSAPYSGTWILTNADGTQGAPAWIEAHVPGIAPISRWSTGTGYSIASDRMTLVHGDPAGGPALNDVWVLANASGRTAAGSAGLGTIVNDDFAVPLHADAGPDQVVEATSAAGAGVELDGGGSVAATSYTWTGDFGARSGATALVHLGLGTHLITLTVQDGSGNSSLDTVRVAVVDTTAPLVTAPSGVTAEATSPVGAVVTFSTSAADAVSGSPSVTCTPASGSTFALDTTRVHCRAVDGVGNTGSAEFDVLVHDTTPPSLSLPAPITATVTSLAGTTVVYSATATDAVDPAPAVSCSPASGSLFGAGITNVTCTARDVRGNVALGAFTVWVNYSFAGFLPPISNDGSSLFKLGRTVPVKFRLLMGGAPVCSPSATIQVFRVLDQATGTHEVDTAASGSSNVDNLFRCDDGMYIYSLNTRGYPTGTFMIRVNLQDGSQHEVRVSIR